MEVVVDFQCEYAIFDSNVGTLVKIINIQSLNFKKMVSSSPSRKYPFYHQLKLQVAFRSRKKILLNIAAIYRRNVARISPPPS